MKSPLTPEQAYEFIKGSLDMDGDLYDRLYAFYTSHERGEDAMPYGTAKARDGDPYLWIEMQLRRDIEYDIGQPWTEVERMADCVKDVGEFVYLYCHEALHALVQRTPIPPLAEEQRAVVNAFIDAFHKSEAERMSLGPTPIPTPEGWNKVNEILGKETKH